MIIEERGVTKQIAYLGEIGRFTTKKLFLRKNTTDDPFTSLTIIEAQNLRDALIRYFEN